MVVVQEQCNETQQSLRAPYRRIYFSRSQLKVLKDLFLAVTNMTWTLFLKDGSFLHIFFLQLSRNCLTVLWTKLSKDG